MTKYCKYCGQEKPRDNMTLYEGKMICQCYLGLPPYKVELWKK